MNGFYTHTHTHIYIYWQIIGPFIKLLETTDDVTIYLEQSEDDTSDSSNLLCILLYVSQLTYIDIKQLFYCK